MGFCWECSWVVCVGCMRVSGRGFRSQVSNSNVIDRIIHLHWVGVLRHLHEIDIYWLSWPCSCVLLFYFWLRLYLVSPRPRCPRSAVCCIECLRTAWRGRCCLPRRSTLWFYGGQGQIRSTSDYFNRYLSNWRKGTVDDEHFDVFGVLFG